MARLDYNKCIAEDITDPTPYEESERELFDGECCAYCREPFFRGEYVYSVKPPMCSHSILIHARHYTDRYNEVKKVDPFEFLEEIGCSVILDEAGFMDGGN